MCDHSRVASKEVAGAPEREIEVTPEMIAAGVEVFWDLPEILGPSSGELRECVRKSFIAMVKTLPRPCREANKHA